MTDIKQHEYALLNEIAQDSKVTQANLSARLGIAVGSVNWYIKRLINRGWIKVSRLDRTRLKYDLTAEGVSVFTQRAMMYARDSLKTYMALRSQAKLLVSDVKHQGIMSVFLDGDDELMDILRLTCIENGLLVLDSPKDVILRTSGQGYEMVRQPEG
jgi:DNA-binding MarR family transcriptional regulator